MRCGFWGEDSGADQPGDHSGVLGHPPTPSVPRSSWLGRQAQGASWAWTTSSCLTTASQSQVSLLGPPTPSHPVPPQEKHSPRQPT